MSYRDAGGPSVWARATAPRRRRLTRRHLDDELKSSSIVRSAAATRLLAAAARLRGRALDSDRRRVRGHDS